LGGGFLKKKKKNVSTFWGALGFFLGGPEGENRDKNKNQLATFYPFKEIFANFFLSGLWKKKKKTPVWLGPQRGGPGFVVVFGGKEKMPVTKKVICLRGEKGGGGEKPLMCLGDIGFMSVGFWCCVSGGFGGGGTPAGFYSGGGKSGRFHKSPGPVSQAPGHRPLKKKEKRKHFR